MNTWTLLASDLIGMVLLMSVAALPSFRTKDASYVDGLWGLAFVVLAFGVALRTNGDPVRTALLVGLTTLWGLRLGGYLLRRWRRQGPDARYQAMMGPNPSASRLWLQVFVLQGTLITVVSLPVQLGALSRGAMSWWNWFGAALALAGILWEAVADGQLAAFKKDPAHHGRVMDKGLWAWSRHPNYFGEFVTWWGLGLLALHDTVTTLGLLGPAAITWFLLTKSGIGPLERQLANTKPNYRDYVARTSGFVPRRPRSGTYTTR